MGGMNLQELDRLLFQLGDERRWVQDSPILPNVWNTFVADPGERIDLLITPHRGTRPKHLADAIRNAIEPTVAPATPTEEASPDNRCAIAFNQSIVVARLFFNELIEHVVPLSSWFEKQIGPHLAAIREIASLRSTAGKSRLGAILRDLKQEDERPTTFPRLVIWWLRLTGRVSLRLAAPDGPEPVPEEVWQRALSLLPAKTDRAENAPRMFQVALNRRAEPASAASVRTVKGDAAQRVFNVDTSRICWAVLDSGIDLRHPAFLGAAGKPRVTQSYDFTRIRELIDLASAPGDGAALAIRERFGVDPEVVDRMRTALATGSDLDWEALKPALQVDPGDDAYFAALNPHGTHVAGILGGTEKPLPGADDDFRGMCPDMQLIDIRILDKEGHTKKRANAEEFDIMAALQFVAHLNSVSRVPVVHGVNLSIQLQHNPKNYACGRTPVCEECNRLVACGVVVVVAAGNMGIDGGVSTANTTEGAFRSISIADPGNAESVITVGSTHRSEPHTYGVSFFSSRGPTGDGRAKPDLVAPGEKVVGPVRKDAYDTMQGTSQAAPYVSGAAAMLLARHSELIGDPARVKAILCQTATDLGRLRDYQGAGLVDILRAMQSV